MVWADSMTRNMQIFVQKSNWVLIGACLILGINCALLWGHELDDALIYARYLQNLIDGNGYVYNPGEYVNGLTSPLFGYLSIVPALILGDARDGVMLVSVLAAFASMISFYYVLRLFITSESMAAVSALLSALASITYMNLGMEASLFTTLIAVSFYLYFKAHYFYLGICIGLAILARPEGVFLVPAMAMMTLFSDRNWPSIKCYVTPTLLVGSQLAFNYFYYEAFLPSSGLAKLSQGESGLWGANNFLMTLIGLFPFGVTHIGSWPILFVLLLLAVCSIMVQSARRYLVLSFTFLAFYTSFFALLNLPAQAWYYAIHYSLFWSYVALGVCGLSDKFLSERDSAVNSGLIAFMLAGLFLQEPRLLSELGRTVRADYKEIGIWLSQNTAEDSSVAVVEIGTIGWYSKRRIIDILGLVTADVSSYVAEGDFESWLKLFPPDYIVVHEPLWEFERVIGQVSQEGGLLEVADFDFPGFKLYAFNSSEVLR
jgi:hypothetical protein